MPAQTHPNRRNNSIHSATLLGTIYWRVSEVNKTLLSVVMENCDMYICMYIYVRHQNVEQVQNYIKWAEFSPNDLGVEQPIGTAQK